MPRITDKIHQLEIILPSELRSLYSTQSVKDYLKESLVDAQKFIVDNIDQYVHSFPNKTAWDLCKIPCLTPPFDTFWMEYQVQDQSIKDRGLNNIGIFFYARDGRDYSIFREYLYNAIPEDIFGQIKWLLADRKS